MDCTMRSAIVLDSFLGSGTTVIAAERTGRICYGIVFFSMYVSWSTDHGSLTKRQEFTAFVSSWRMKDECLMSFNSSCLTF
jgi:hypothetical protein